MITSMGYVGGQCPYSVLVLTLQLLMLVQLGNITLHSIITYTWGVVLVREGKLV
jgi:hypothetical protein